MKRHFDPVISSRLAKQFGELHKPGQPVLLTNIWDSPTLKLALENPKTVAVATASFAIAAVNGLDDEELDHQTSLAALNILRRTMIKSNKHTTIPFSADIQDGYGPFLEDFIKSVITLGVVGVNIEDVYRTTTRSLSPTNPLSIEETLSSPQEAAIRVKTILEVARSMGVENFVVNARTDCVKLGGTVEEAIERGKLFLEAGATTVFVWGGARGLRGEEVKRLVDGLEGRVAVICKRGEGFLSVKQVKELGVARISMGPGLWREGMAAIKNAIDDTITNYEQRVDK